MKQQSDLRRTLGILAVIAFGVTNEVGAGLFFISTQIQQTAPGVGNLVPWLMIVGGLITFAIAIVYRYFFSSGLIGAGGEYVMISRSVGRGYAFIATFLAWFGFSGALGTLAYAAPKFMAAASLSMGAISLSHYLASPTGTLIIGLGLLWGVWFIHVRGIRLAGVLTVVAMFIVIAVTIVIIIYGFSTTQHTFEVAISRKVHIAADKIINAAPVQHLNFVEAFKTALPILFFGYLGLSTATQTGDEAINARHSLARAVIIAPLIVAVIYTLFTFALYHAVRWQLIAGLATLGMSTYTTSTGLLGIVMPPWLAITINIAVAIIVVKAFLPIFLAQSRWIYAWSKDGIIPAVFGQTHKKYKTPVLALCISALLGSVSLIESIKYGYVFGVSIRLLAVMIVFIFLGIGMLVFRRTAPMLYAENKSWMAKKRGIQIGLALFTITISSWFGLSIAFGDVNEPLLFQPIIQTLLVAAVGGVIYGLRHGWKGEK